MSGRLDRTMSVIHRIEKAANDPGLARAWLRAKFFPTASLNRLVSLSRAAGFRAPCFVLSFDCDTDADSAVVGALHAELRAAGLSPLYAVAGEVMAASETEYRAVAADGGRFLNHGHRRHAEIDTGSDEVVSNYFYGDVGAAEWMQDIRLGDDAVRQITGRAPSGFRAPHFATFESPADLRALWRFLADLGYRHSSSTRPLFALRHGPMFRREGVWEFPVSGCIGQYEQILDSWGLVRSAAGSTGRLLEELQRYLAVMAEGTPVFVNIYLDPADIAHRGDALDALKAFAPYSASDYDAVLARTING
jgi:hypothetical protein